jgi:hypothetical protein
MSGRKCRIWIVSELYKPSNTSTAHILAQLTDFLSRDYEVFVIAGKSASYKYGLNENTVIFTDEEIKYIQSPFVRGKILRLVFGLIFSIKATIYLLRNIEHGDKILAVTNPQTLILILPYFFKKNLTFLIHDIFPENLIATSLGFSQFVGRFLNPIYNVSYKQLTNAIVLGDDMKQVIERKGVKNVSIIRNWADEELKINPFPMGKFRILYAGNVGHLQGLQVFLSWFKQLNENLFELHIRGEGEAKQELMLAVNDYNMNNVHFDGPYKRDEQSTILGMAHFGLVSLDDKMFGFGVPSKFYNIVKAGRPVLYFGPKFTEIYNSVNLNSLGLVIDIDEPIEVVSERMISLIRQCSPEYYENIYNQKYSKQNVKRQLLNYFKDID